MGEGEVRREKRLTNSRCVGGNSQGTLNVSLLTSVSCAGPAPSEGQNTAKLTARFSLNKYNDLIIVLIFLYTLHCSREA